jgi:hypothetical protein
VAANEVRIEPGGTVEARGDSDEAADRASQAKPAEKWYEITLENSIHFDTNPEVKSDDEDQDWADVVKLAAVGRFFKNEKVEVGGQYAFYGEFYSDADERDLMGHTLGLYLTRMATPVSFRCDYQFGLYILDDETYLRKHSLMPMLFWVTSGRSMELFRLSVASNDYPEDEGLEGSDWSLQLRHYYFLDAAKNVRLSLGYKYTSTDADDNSEDNAAHRYSADIKMAAPAGMSVLVRVNYTSKNYRGSRDDEKLGYRLELTKALSDIWSFTFGLDSTNNNSDEALAGYRRDIGFFSIRAVL